MGASVPPVALVPKFENGGISANQVQTDITHRFVDLELRLFLELEATIFGPKGGAGEKK